ncbi:MAG: acetolactate synthase small subunit [Desulfobulbaceae bacterium]|nr:acetolactate synthase small subunit [Desulfobulbaceae bacterium]
MQKTETHKSSGTPDKPEQKVLELTVNNHPGVMSHIWGLFSRRAFNMGGILCMPVDDGRVSRIWIRVDGNGQLEQIVKQLQKLEDVQDVRYHDAGHEVFVRLEEYFEMN